MGLLSHFGVQSVSITYSEVTIYANVNNIVYWFLNLEMEKICMVILILSGSWKYAKCSLIIISGDTNLSQIISYYTLIYIYIYIWKFMVYSKEVAVLKSIEIEPVSKRI